MRAFATALLAAATLTVPLNPAAAATPGPAAVAITRCDSKNINEAQDQVQDWERHPPRGTQDQLKRLADLQDTVQAMGEERGVLQAVCPETMSLAKYDSQIAAVQAWAFALESDVALALGPPCPSAGNAIPNQLLASAWFALAGNANENGKAAPSVAAVIPKVNARRGDRPVAAGLLGHLGLLGRYHPRHGQGRNHRL